MDQTDKDHILRTNQYYIAQVSSMEIKISELKAQLHAKDFEIDYLTSKLSPSKSVYNKNLENHELGLKLQIALQENEVLKKQIAGLDEIGTLKSQLEHALRMKDLFEEKYRDNERKLREDFQKSFENIHQENASLKIEVIDRNKVIQELKKKVFKTSQAENERKNSQNLSIGSPNLFHRPSSATQ